MGKKKIYYPSKKKTKLTVTPGSTERSEPTKPRARKVGRRRYTLNPSQPPPFMHRRHSPIRLLTESPGDHFSPPIPLNHSSPYPLDAPDNFPSTRTLPSPLCPISIHNSPTIPVRRINTSSSPHEPSNEASSPIYTPRNYSLDRVASTFPVQHSSPIANVSTHSPAPPAASPIGPRRAKSKRQKKLVTEPENTEAVLEPETVPPLSPQMYPSPPRPTPRKQLNVTQDKENSPILNIPTPFQDRQKKNRRKRKKPLIFRPTKLRVSKKPNPALVPKPKRVKLQTDSAPSSSPEGELKPKGKLVPEYVEVRVEGGKTINLQLLYAPECMGTPWQKSGDIHFAVGTTTEQFRWGLMNIVALGSKPVSLSKDWMLFTLLYGAAQVFVDEQIAGNLVAPGHTLLVPPGHYYQVSNPGRVIVKLQFCVIILT